MSLLFSFLLPTAMALAATCIGTRLLLPVLQKKKLAQTILEIGPKWHKKKEGTPTMGGIVFLLTALFFGSLSVLAIWQTRGQSEALPLLFLILYAILNGLIGIKDDLTKFRMHRNAGMTPMQKIVLQTAAGALFLALLHITDCVDTTLFIPYIAITVELSYFYDFIVLFLLVGIVNCTNLTDGVDGLCSSVVAVIGAFFGVAAYITSSSAVFVSASLLSGISLGFLFFNHHPAKIFMGDTGSLFFGALTAGTAVILGNPLILIVVCMVFVLEGISDILQVFVYKLTKKRILRMAPLHHHFEMIGFSENKIVLLFVGIGLAFAGIAALSFLAL